MVNQILHHTVRQQHSCSKSFQEYCAEYQENFDGMILPLYQVIMYMDSVLRLENNRGSYRPRHRFYRGSSSIRKSQESSEISGFWSEGAPRNSWT